MNELIKITEKDGKKIVNARDLHRFLDSKQDFSNWIKDRIEKFDFIENSDFCCIYLDYRGEKIIDIENQLVHKIEYAISIDMAKELSMVEGNEKGKQARRYFLDCEKKVNQQDSLTHPTRKQLAQWVIEQEEKIEKLELENKNKSQQLSIAAPKILFADSVNAAQNSILVADLAKLLKQKGIDIGEKRLYEWLRQNGYLCSKGQYRNTPTQKAMELGLFEVLERSMIDRKHDSVFVALTTKITGKGQIYFINKFLKVSQTV